MGHQHAHGKRLFLSEVKTASKGENDNRTPQMFKLTVPPSSILHSRLSAPVKEDHGKIKQITFISQKYRHVYSGASLVGF